MRQPTSKMMFLLALLGLAWLGDATTVGAGRARITHISHNGELGVAEPFRATTLTGHAVGLGSRAASARYVWLLEGAWHQGNPVTFNFTKLGHQTVRLFVCTGRACPQRFDKLSATSSWSSSWCSGQRSLCKEQTVLVQYVRRELRDLPAAEWRLWAETMVYLKNTPQAVLTERHGANALTWDALAARHFIASLNVTCDHAHAYGSFIPFHRVLLRAWEVSVQAVHPHLAMPYWDVFYDMDQLGNLSSSFIFSDEYVGTSGVAANGYVVTDGRFASPKWPIPAAAAYLPTHMHGPYGLMRSPFNLNNASHLSRRIGNRFDVPADTPIDWPSVDTFRTCMEEPDQVSMDKCVMIHHSFTHVRIGGGWNAEIPLNVDNATQDKLAGQDGERANWLFGRLICDTNCDQALGTTACVCHCDDTSFVVDRDVALRSSGTCAKGMPGDFFDVTNSVLDPLFIFYHAHWDKFLMDYQTLNADGDRYSGYQETDLCTNIDNLIGGNPDIGFSQSLMGLSNTNSTDMLTLRQSIDFFLPAAISGDYVSPYTYQAFSAWNGTEPLQAVAHL